MLRSKENCVCLFPVFSLLGNPLIDMDLRNACTCIESTLLYSVPLHKRVSSDNVWAQDLALAIRRVKEEFTACGVHIPGHPRGISPLRGGGSLRFPNLPWESLGFPSYPPPLEHPPLTNPTNLECYIFRRVWNLNFLILQTCHETMQHPPS